MKRARIVGTGSYVPQHILTNQELEKKVETSDEWIRTRTGIRERRIAAEGECTSDLAAQAARQALTMAGVSPEEIDLIVVGTITGDFPWPATACLVQEKIGAKRAFAYDLSAACSGFVFALDAAVKQIQCGAINKALVIGAEILSRIVDWEDRNTCVLFGDGAGAVVLSAEEGDHGVLSTHLHSDGSYWELLYQAGFGARHPANARGLDERVQFLKMQGNEVFKVAVRMLTEVAQEALAHNGMECQDIDLFIPHQANRRILEAVAKRLHLRDDQVYINVDYYGNTSGASIPIALDEVNRAGGIKPGDILMFDAFGGGFTWGAALVRW
ncbi:beta-ketoacyl-ACP synthase III [Geoalkalibacter halelectricus]|uniref:Beta-ketoacyl-[acyl-carrier-protein] synthase III n=1 Tax=Geoalkalibacter halelectricus TaxID=2847045 RepID=A0ABY5ZPK4_9BACT|nr:beta-ketoacyl-ACP synthase III [Geoalkalibacter halelectricus]MDO3380031.1 ketoacyl-ACP synthase III [Geoalkalibacter halelectricus]UWZ80444.1 ketoacyl-ACP synthase III [Geoalkalibacter halelectricus]